MLFLIRALSRLCHLSLVPSWHTLCPFAACVTGSWDVSALCDSFSGVTALPRLLLFLWHAGTCNHLSTGYTCTKLPGPSAAVSATAAAQAATHPWLQNIALHHWELSGKINSPVYCVVSCITTIPAQLSLHILGQRRKGCPVGKAELQPSTLAALLVKYSSPLLSALLWDLHKARARSRSPAGDLSAGIPAEGAKPAGCWWQCQGLCAKHYPEVQPHSHHRKQACTEQRWWTGGLNIYTHTGLMIICKRPWRHWQNDLIIQAGQRAVFKFRDRLFRVYSGRTPPKWQRRIEPHHLGSLKLKGVSPPE